MIHRAALVFVALFTITTAHAEDSTDSLIQVADYLELEQVGDAQISPDGRQVIYTRRYIDQVNDRWTSSVWIMDSDGERQRFLIDGSSPRWSPDGSRILFLAGDSNGKPQIFVRWMDDEGAVSQVTRVSVTPSTPTWSPDSKSIAFVAIVPARESWNIDLPSPPEGATWTKPPRILDQLHYRQDRVGFRDPGYSHLFVVPAESGSARQLTDGKWHVGAQFDGLFFGAGLSWTPDSKRIVIDGYDSPDHDLAYRRSHLYAVDVSSGEKTQLTRDTGYWLEPAVSPDGDSIAFIGYPDTENTYAMPRLYVIDADGDNQRLLTGSFDRPLNNLFWDNNSRGILFTAQDEGYINVFRSDLNGRVSPVTRGKQSVSLQSVNGVGRVGAGVLSNFYEPGDVYTFPLTGQREPTRLTAVNADMLDGKTLGEHTEIWFEAEDGNRAHGWIVKPPNFEAGKQYPMIFEIHGGPFAMYQGRFDFRYQAFAAQGFVVLYTNPRGSTGYGEAFSLGINKAYPSVDYLDLMGGVDAAIAQGFIDEDRMYVGGCSGGGVLSSWVIGHTDRFAAAAVRCPVVNWISMAGTTDVPNFTYSFFDKPFWEDPDAWLKTSPLMYVGNVTTPTLVMTGEEDLRTPMPQSEEYYAALKVRGVPAKLMRFDSEYHGTGSKPSNAMRTMLYMMSWYNMWTEDGEVSDEQEEQ
ncbi:MAG: S9 family peptidase [Pseudomonadota bacterium]